ncbi:MAG: hypothetical protein CMJ41_00270 [Phycisphaerae bacterium]|nr:hypothetical protein [Phycisphaerae bacterium]
MRPARHRAGGRARHAFPRAGRRPGHPRVTEASRGTHTYSGRGPDAVGQLRRRRRPATPARPRRARAAGAGTTAD